jgi:carbon-monoxide dehydrogenase iron sulfur subunit
MAVSARPKKIMINHKTCTGCRMCEQICTFARYHEFNPRRAKIRILMREKEGINAPLLCTQCKTCLTTCKREALSWDEKLGVVLVDAKKCNACGLCVDACPQAAITVDPITNTVNICDLCGGDPQCVKWCSEGTIKFEEVPEPVAAPAGPPHGGPPGGPPH